MPGNLFKLRTVRGVLLEVRKAVRVARERRVPLGVGLPEGFRGGLRCVLRGLRCVLYGLRRFRRVELQQFRHLRGIFPELPDRLPQFVGL